MIKLSAFMRLMAERWRRVAAADLFAFPERPASRLMNVRPLGALALALIPGIAGCAVGPDFVTPPPPVAAKYLEWRNGAIGTSREDYRDWWTAFHDPVLNRLIEIAYNQNLTLLSAGTQVLQARAQLGIQVGEFYPQQQQGVGFTSYNRPSHADAVASPQVNLSNYWQSALGASASWQLDFWGKFRRGVESADAAYLASIATYDDVLVTLLGDVASTYIGIRTLEKQIAIARENIVRQKEALQIARDRFNGGAATEVDVYQAENVLGQTEASIPQLTIQLQQGENALRVLLGMSPEPLGSLLGRETGRIPVAPPKIFVGIPADLLRRNPSVRAAELKAAAQSAQIGVAQSDLYPAISLTGVIGGYAATLNGHYLGQVFTAPGLTYSVRTLVPMEHPQLWTDHQQRTAAGRDLAAISRELSKLRPHGPAEHRERHLHLSAIEDRGRRSSVTASRPPMVRSGSRSSNISKARATTPPC